MRAEESGSCGPLSGSKIRSQFFRGRFSFFLFIHEFESQQNLLAPTDAPQRARAQRARRARTRRPPRGSGGACSGFLHPDAVHRRLDGGAPRRRGFGGGRPGEHDALAFLRDRRRFDHGLFGADGAPHRRRGFRRRQKHRSSSAPIFQCGSEATRRSLETRPTTSS